MVKWTGLKTLDHSKSNLNNSTSTKRIKRNESKSNIKHNRKQLKIKLKHTYIHTYIQEVIHEEILSMENFILWIHECDVIANATSRMMLLCLFFIFFWFESLTIAHPRWTDWLDGSFWAINFPWHTIFKLTAQWCVEKIDSLKVVKKIEERMKKKNRTTEKRGTKPIQANVVLSESNFETLKLYNNAFDAHKLAKQTCFSCFICQVCNVHC